MKSSQQILGLPVLSIEEGREIGEVRYIILNPSRGAVDFLLISDDQWYLEHKLLAFKDVKAIGEYALTVAAASSLAPVSSSPGALELLKKDFTLPGIRVLTQGGRLVGSISEYYIDPSSGKITACRLLPLNGQEPGHIPRSSILTYGSDYLVAVDNVEEQLTQEVDFLEQASQKYPQEDALPSQEKVPEVKDKPKTDEQPGKQQDEESPPGAGLQGDSSVLKLFQEEQRQYLVGKKLTADILAGNGETIARKGEIVTPEIIDKAQAADRYTMLTLNVSD